MNIFKDQLKAIEAGVPFAVLTVVESEGTSPWNVGKKMLLLEDGSAFGTIGGGVLESQILNEAAIAIKNGKSFFQKYTTSLLTKQRGLGAVSM